MAKLSRQIHSGLFGTTGHQGVDLSVTGTAFRALLPAARDWNQHTRASQTEPES
jgi:hypothetical protein